ncbi:MAG: bifunctional 4-hydroxy-2-oxoglutarate aldolase/2-dehydro-3-deoxy-phosphogluconate aldolase [Candidatus Omnitrophota bacterium]
MTMDIARFEKLPLMGIIRGVDVTDIGPLIETTAEAGLETIEVAMNTPDAAKMISKIREISKGSLIVGAGTVISKNDLDAALGSGASFIVMPSLVEDLVKSCVEKGVPVFPGALTPREVLEAWECGAAMVKVFPSNVFGPGYMKALKGPFGKIKLMAVGGIRLETIPEYFSSGADAVAFGGGVFKKEWLEAKDFESIGKLVKQYVEAVKEARCR